ncbi:MAG: hypothetical protein HY744_14545 [Deltaproteobacteria bacterium]|nr:hypothetical protein [Deltaproteobacteria bacterium]
MAAVAIGRRTFAARAGHCRVELGDLGLVEAADELLWLKHAIGHVARRLGYSATFMPQPLHGAAGSGLGCRQALWQGDRNLFAGPGAGATSDLCRWYAAGILAHAPALAALANPTTNSFRRLASPGAPTELAWPPPEQAAALQLVGSAPAPQSELGIEARFPDPSCNPYLALSALLMAGLDGIRRRLDPPAPKRRRSAPRGAASTGTGRLPASLGEALDAIERDHGFLLEGEVFGAELIERSVRDKREREIAEQAARPVPYEFELYYDV